MLQLDVTHWGSLHQVREILPEARAEYEKYFGVNTKVAQIDQMRALQEVDAELAELSELERASLLRSPTRTCVFEPKRRATASADVEMHDADPDGLGLPALRPVTGDEQVDDEQDSDAASGLIAASGSEGGEDD